MAFNKSRFVFHKLIRPYFLLAHKLGGPAFPEELDYWEKLLSHCPASYFDPAIRYQAFPQELRDCLNRIPSIKGKLPKVLELGSGPVSLLMSGVDEGVIEVVAVDPLAHAYGQILKMYDLKFSVKPVHGYGENLGRYVNSGPFDLAYSSNALDHTNSPEQCLRSISNLIRPGGFLILEGFVREGSSGNWFGLHQHDLFLLDNRLMHEDRSHQVSDLCDKLPMEMISQKVQQFSSRSIHAFGYEPDETIQVGSPQDWLQRDWYTIVFRKAY